MQTLTVLTPATVYYNASAGASFRVTDRRGRLHYWRKIPATGEHKFNVPLAGVYNVEGGTVVRKGELIKKRVDILLPIPQRTDRVDKDQLYIAERNVDMGSPAATQTTTGAIRTSKRFETFPPPIQLFILLHEEGHLFYKDEDFCDYYALVHFLDKGYNQSTALFALTRVLKCGSGKNAERIEKIFNKIKLAK